MVVFVVPECLVQDLVPSHLSAYGKHREILAGLGGSGFSVVLNYTRRGPEYFESTYPTEWQDEYENGHYYYKDPVFIWALAANGDKRWSEIPVPDLGRIMRIARRHGLIFGAAFARTINRNKSLISVARDDRELTDDEMTALSAAVNELVSESGRDQSLSPKELGAIQCLADDMNLDQAADHLGVSSAAVKARLSTARAKLGIATNYHLVAAALRAKLIR
jgi:LuxR family transcriptional regulator, quorum-sensing system regulator SdiA